MTQETIPYSLAMRSELPEHFIDSTVLQISLAIVILHWQVNSMTQEIIPYSLAMMSELPEHFSYCTVGNSKFKVSGAIAEVFRQ